MSISKEDQIAYWSSEEFLNKYFQKLKFDEPYIKGEYQKWHKFAAFKWWHKREVDKR